MAESKEIRQNNYKQCLEINGDISNLGDRRNQSKTTSGSQWALNRYVLSG